VCEGEESRGIDYGTGHEAAFLGVLYCASLADESEPEVAEDLATVAFPAYVRVMRRLQRTYVLEPAGSHGVWGLDDFHFLPFLLGAAQLSRSDADISVGDILQHAEDPDLCSKYLYVAAVREILDVKKGCHFSESSPVLWDISAVPNWSKVHMGLCKMYEAEVWGKRPVIQHYLFGEVIPFDPDHPNPAG
jgi:serine/threonine-protein phosphatase 2A activator